MMNRSQDSYLRTGNANEYRVRGEDSNWWVEGTDNNKVWVDAEPGFTYKTKAEAIRAAGNLASQSGGTFVDSVWGTFRRGTKWYIETRDGKQSIDERLSARLNDGGQGYATEAKAQAVLIDWLTED